MSEPESEVLSSSALGSARFSGAIAVYLVFREQGLLLGGIAFAHLSKKFG
jgi:hypothetical protein